AAPLHPRGGHRPHPLPPPAPGAPMTIALAVAAVALPSASGLAAAALRRRPAAAQATTCALLCAGAAAGVAAAVAVLLGGDAVSAPRLALRVDALSALFLVPVSLLSGLGAIYGLRYHPQAALGGAAVRLQVFYGLNAGGMAL